MKKTFLAVACCSVLTLQSHAFSFPTGSTTCTNENTTVTSTLLLDLLEDNLAQSSNLLQMSANLSSATLSLSNINVMNQDYLLAMLRLSTDIGSMADNIGTMADRIVQTEVLIGEMGDRIVTVAQTLIDNNAQTQLNILQAQTNLNNALTNLN